MAYITFQPKDNFNTKLWTGTGSENAITGIGFQPDWVWIKQRNTTRDHNEFDAVRGATKRLYPNLTNAEETAAQVLKSFDSDGFTLGTDTSANQSSGTYVGWNWKANGAGSANSDGNANNVVVSANTTSGFSIVQGDMNASGSWTFGHGLGVAPSLIFLRGQNVTSHWFMYHKSLGAGNYMTLNGTGASASNTTFMANTAPTSSVFSMNAGTWSAGAGEKIIAYCFAEKTGFSKFGKYVGNGSANGTFIHTGFKPAFVIIKRSSDTGDWYMHDNKRDVDNPVDISLSANSDNADNTQNNILDLVSNGFKIRTTGTGYNNNGSTYIYMAFAEEPLVSSNNIPATAR